jgi:hypothetical protein
MHSTIADQSGLLGRVTFRNFELVNDRSREIDRILQTAHDLSTQVWDSLITELRQLCAVREFEATNLVVLAGRAVVARRLIGDLTYSGTIDYGALGTSATAVNAADTQLGAEVARKLFARRTRTNAVCNFDFYYSQADTNGTYQEFGTVIDGTATANTGQLFNHLLTGGWTKTNTEAMTVSLQISINP